ncbi:hypothetical protein LTR53_019736, partial [Teratosphaeriaceae sp. CCFEE 6253]
PRGANGVYLPVLPQDAGRSDQEHAPQREDHDAAERVRRRLAQEGSPQIPNIKRPCV